MNLRFLILAMCFLFSSCLIKKNIKTPVKKNDLEMPPHYDVPKKILEEK